MGVIVASDAGAIQCGSVSTELDTICDCACCISTTTENVPGRLVIDLILASAKTFDVPQIILEAAEKSRIG
jgi:hypothetical protein